MQVDRISPEWVRACTLVDELWLPSRHLIGAFVSAGVNASLLRHATDESSTAPTNRGVHSHTLYKRFFGFVSLLMKAICFKSVSRYLYFSSVVDFPSAHRSHAESCPRRSTRPRSRRTCIANWSLSRRSPVRPLCRRRLRPRRHRARQWINRRLRPEHEREASECTRRTTFASRRFRGRRSNRAASTISCFCPSSSGRNARAGMCCYAPISAHLQCQHNPLQTAAELALM